MKRFTLLTIIASAFVVGVCVSGANVTSQPVDDYMDYVLADAPVMEAADLFGGDAPLTLHKYDLELTTAYIEENPLRQPQTDAKSERMERRYRAGINNENSNAEKTYLKGKPTTRFLSWA